MKGVFSIVALGGLLLFQASCSKKSSASDDSHRMGNAQIEVGMKRFQVQELPGYERGIRFTQRSGYSFETVVLSGESYQITYSAKNWTNPDPEDSVVEVEKAKEVHK